MTAVHPDLLPGDAPSGHRPPARTPQRVRAEYEGAESSTRRAPKPSKLLAEDKHLPPAKRRTLVAATRDAIRNYVLVGAAVRKHLDFVARHTVDFTTGDEGLDKDLEEFIEHRSSAENFDVSGRHDRDRFMRLAEARRCIDGDVAALKLRSRHVQAIEGDRIRDPDRGQLGINQREEWSHGVRCDLVGRPVQYAIAKRTASGLVHERIVQASRLLCHAWHDTHFRFDACRGVSPFAPGLNDFIDQHETITHAQAKVKLAAIFGLKVLSEAENGIGEHEAQSGATATESTESEDGEKYTVDLGKGPFKVEMDPGDNIETIEGKTGVSEVVQLMQFVAELAIQVLDLPAHFFDAARVNFHGGKVGTTLYLQSAASKRRDVQRFLAAWTAWQLSRAVQLGEIVLPRSITLESVLRSFLWIPTGLPWFDRSREVRPTLQAIAGGIDNYSRVIHELYGMPFDKWLETRRRDEQLIEAAGVQFANWDKVVFAPDGANQTSEASP